MKKVDSDRQRIQQDIARLTAEKNSLPKTKTVYAAALQEAITECEKILLEREKMVLELKKARYAYASVLLTIVGFGVTYWSTLHTQKQQHDTTIEAQVIQEDAQWEMKAAEILFNTSSREQFNNRLKTLIEIFPDRSARLQKIAQNMPARTRIKKDIDVVLDDLTTITAGKEGGVSMFIVADHQIYEFNRPDNSNRLPKYHLVSARAPEN